MTGPGPTDPDPSLPDAPAVDPAAPAPTAPDTGTAPRAADSTGRRAGLGLVAMMGSTLVTRCGSLVAQVLLGRWLSKDDFGVYGLALSLAVAFQVLQAGGLRLLLVQEGPDAFEHNAGPATFLSLAISTVGAAVLVVAAPWAAVVYDQPSLTPVLRVLAASLVVQSFTLAPIAKLQMDLRFTTAARVDVGSAVVRYGSTILLAAFGAGALSFAVPVLLVSLFELVGYSWAAGIGMVRTIGFGRWRALFGRSRWALFNTLATAVPRQSDYWALGLTAAPAALGVYFFAYQLTFQIATLAINNARKVLFAVFAQRHDDRAWLGSALADASAAVALLASALILGLVPIADELERLLWHGKWADAVLSIRILAVLLPLSLVLLLPDFALQAAGRFKLSFVTSLVGNVGIPVVAFAAGTQVQTVDRTWIAALAVGGYTVASSAFQCLVALRALELSPRRFFVAAGVPSMVGIAWAVVLVAVGAPGPPLVQVVVLGGAFVAGYVALARLTAPRALATALRLGRSLPGTGLARRVLRLPAA